MNKFLLPLVLCWIGCPAWLWAQSTDQKSEPLQEDDLRALRGVRQIAFEVSRQGPLRETEILGDAADILVARLKEAGIEVVPRGPGIPLLRFTVNVAPATENTPPLEKGPDHRFLTVLGRPMASGVYDYIITSRYEEETQLQRGEKRLVIACTWPSGGCMYWYGEISGCSLEETLWEHISQHTRRLIKEWKTANPEAAPVPFRVREGARPPRSDW